MMEGFCRTYVILAREAPKAVILRRGPSDWVQLILWHTDTDILEYGQWFKGRVYERRCDLSPDGKLFLYFVRKKNKRMIQDEAYTYAWTAVSKPPFFTALALWPKGDSWNGGGFFEDNSTIHLNHNPERLQPHPDHQPQGLTIVQEYDGKGEDFLIYNKLLARRGWSVLQEGGRWRSKDWYREQPDRPKIWQKAHKTLPFTLLMKLLGSDIQRYGDDLILEFEIQHERTGAVIPLSDTAWADWDQHGRLVFISKGLLYFQLLYPKIEKAELIADINSKTPGTVLTPEWAQHW
jgi:hypothetical protein